MTFLLDKMFWLFYLPGDFASFSNLTCLFHVFNPRTFPNIIPKNIGAPIWTKDYNDRYSFLRSIITQQLPSNKRECCHLASMPCATHAPNVTVTTFTHHKVHLRTFFAPASNSCCTLSLVLELKQLTMF